MKSTRQPGDTSNIGTAGHPLSVLIVGAGFAGLCAGIRLLQENEPGFRIIEKASGVGGTWLHNRYPGAACDVPAHLYSFSFAPRPDWSRKYAAQPEIQQYLERCAQASGLHAYIRFGANLTELRLIESIGTWRASFADGSTLYARHVINGAGGLHEPRYPDIPGRDDFSGAAMHTARWQAGVDMYDKRVAVIGTAASAVQVIPELAKVASKLLVFQRTPNYIAPREDREYSAAEKARFARWPWLARAYRSLLFARMEFLLFPLTRRDSLLGRYATRRLNAFMRTQVADPDLQAKLEPDYQLGCKRILLSDDFYPTLNRDKVSLIDAGIRAIEAQGLRDETGQLHEVDVIVYATGYDIDAHINAIDVYGLGGRRLADEWQDGPEAYQGACVSGFPNYYMVTGPNTGVATTSVVYMVEKQVDYILRLIDHAGSTHLVNVSAEAQKRYNDVIHVELQRSVWASGCESWYRQPDGKIPTLYPGNARRFAAQCRSIRIADFERLPLTTVYDSANATAEIATGEESYVTANGIRIAVQQHGPLDAPVVLLIHGLGVPLSGWPPELVQMLLARGFRVVLFDNRDIGRSELMTLMGEHSIAREYLRSRLGLRVRAPYQLTDMMLDAHALLDELDIESAHVVGVSMGGMIAQLLALHAPSRVTSLTSIMSTTGRRGLPGPTAEVRNQLLKRPGDEDIEERLQHGMRTWRLIASPRWRRSVEETRNFLLRLYVRGVTAGGIARQTLAIMAAPARNQRLATLTVPSLVIHGDSDPLVPVAAGIDTAQAIPGARLEIIEGMGHDLPLEILERVADLIAEHAAAAEKGKRSRAA